MTQNNEDNVCKNLGNRIMIMGSSGSGKSTMAVHLGEITGLQVVHLDRLTRGITTGDLINERVQTAAIESKWIIDGNYSGSRDFRLERADTVIYLDFNRYICLLRLFRRLIRSWGYSHKDLDNGCPMKIDIQSIERIWNYPRLSRDETLDWLSKINPSKQLFYIKGNKEVRCFLQQVRGKV